MTDWVSPFVAKARRVHVYGLGPDYWSGVLGLGDSSPPILMTYDNGTHVKVSVDENGAVTLSTDDNAQPYGIEVDVDLDDADAAVNSRIIDISSAAITGKALSGGSRDGVGLAFDPDTGASTPAVASFAPYTPDGPYLGVSLDGAS